MSDLTLAIATAPRRDSATWTAEQVTWNEIVSWVEYPEVVQDKGAAGGYVGGKLRGTQRRKGEVLCRTLITLDADNLDADDDFPAAVEKLGVRAVAHTTWSHTLQKPKWRVIIPVISPVNPEQYERTVDALMVELGGHLANGIDSFDRSCREPSRFMYRPSTPDPDRYDRTVIASDDLLDGTEWAAKAPKQQAEPKAADDTPYEQLSDHYRDLAREATDRRIRSWQQKFQDMLLWDDDVQDENGGWEGNCTKAASTLMRLGLSTWSPLTMDQAQAEYRAMVPDDIYDAEPRTGTGKIGNKWTAERIGRVEAEHGPLPAPWEEEETFTALGPEPEVPAVVSAELRRQVDAEKRRLAVRKQAEEELRAEASTTVELPAVVSLTDLLAEPDEEVRYRIDRLMTVGGRVVFAGPKKAGKSTMVGNTIRCLVDGDPFLGEFRVEPVQRVVLIDNELDRSMLKRWLREQDIKQRYGRVDLVPLRGRVSTFDLLNPAIRTRWAQLIGPCDVLVFDCLRPVLDALALSEDKDAGRFLNALDELLLESGSRGEAVVVHHMGHGEERARGDSRIQDWPDSLWKLLREKDNESGPRYFWAEGRDTGLPESQLAFDEMDRSLTLTGHGSRQASKQSALDDAVLAVVRKAPGLKVGEIEEQLTVPCQRGDVSKSLARLVTRGLVRQEKGERNAKHNYPITASDDFE